MAIIHRSHARVAPLGRTWLTVISDCRKVIGNAKHSTFFQPECTKCIYLAITPTLDLPHMLTLVCSRCPEQDTVLQPYMAVTLLRRSLLQEFL